MHGMLSLGVLVAALAVLAGWTCYLLLRLYRACPAPRPARAQSPAADRPAAPEAAGPDWPGPPSAPGQEDDQVPTAQPAG